MLKSAQLVAFIATAQPENSKQFYTKTLGLTLLEETPYAIVVESPQAVLRIQKVEQTQPPPYTALGWQVDDIEQTAKSLLDAGVLFKQFEALDQDEYGVWSVPGGAKVAWFNDPDGNLLSITQIS